MSTLPAESVEAGQDKFTYCVQQHQNLHQMHSDRNSWHALSKPYSQNGETNYNGESPT